MNQEQLERHRAARRAELTAAMDDLIRDCATVALTPGEMRHRLTLISDEYVPGWTTSSPELIDEWAATTKVYDGLHKTVETLVAAGVGHHAVVRALAARAASRQPRGA